MTLIIETADTRQPERMYMFSILMGDFLGLEWAWKPSSRRGTRITLDGHLDKELILSDVLFLTAENDWLTHISLPLQPLVRWDTNTLGLSSSLTEPVVPILYGSEELLPMRSRDKICLPIDVFGSAFFMQTRYEEIVKAERDEHNRFPGWASLAHQEGFLERPIIDEYVEVMWAAIHQLWPSLKRKQRAFRIQVSHDVDRPSRYQFVSSKKLIRAIAGDMIKRDDFALAIRAPVVRWGSRKVLHPLDPFNTFEWLMDVSEEQGLTSAFYFICGRTHRHYDADYEPDDQRIRALMRRIHERGHEIGLHPSYNTYLSSEHVKDEARRLKRICAEEGIRQDKWGGRMHYLRWEQPQTLRAWAHANIDYDNTLTYADLAGFRCGTCHEYQAFDPLAHAALPLRIRPLVAMESTVLSPKYMALGDTEAAEEKFDQLKIACQTVSGVFTLLWHNSELTTTRNRSLYRKALSIPNRASSC